MDVRGRHVPALLLTAAAVGLVPSVLSPSDLPCHRDLLDFVVPMKVHFARSVASGALPWWEPFTLGGQPFVANLQSQVFYPPNWIHLVLDLPWALSFFLAGHLLLGGLGARGLAASLGAGPAPALLAGGSYLAGGFLVSLTDLTNQLCTAAWLPWTCWAALRFVRSPEPRRLAAWAACVLASLLSAAPQHAAMGGLFSVLLALAASGAPARRAWGRALGGGLLAALLAAFAATAQLGPFAELVALSDRAAGEAAAPEGKHSLTGAGLLSFVRAPTGALDAPAGPFVRSLYLGPLTLLCVAAAALRRDRTVLALALLSAVSLVMAAGPGLPGPSRWWAEATPFLRYPIKYAGVAALGLPLLAALGLQELSVRLGSSRGASRWSVVLFSWTVAVACSAELVRAHRGLVLALPVHRVLAPTEVIELLAANTRADGPRVHALPLTSSSLEKRARLLMAHGPLAVARDRVELLEGALPSVFEVYSTWGAAALTPADRSELLERAAGPVALDLLGDLQAGFLLAPDGSGLPLTAAPARGGAAELYVLTDAPPFPERRWEGPNRAVGAPGLGPPGSYPGWREGPPGTWTFRPRGWRSQVAASGVGLAVLLCVAFARGPRGPRRDPPGADKRGLGPS